MSRPSRGLFKKYGLDVDIERVKSGTEAIAFLTQGSIDVGGIAIVTSLWNGWNRGMDIRIIAPGALEPFENSPTKLVVRKALKDRGKVKDIADLKGMRVAVAGGPGSGGEYLLAKALERAKLTIRDVQAINLGNADMPPAFENGSIDAAILGSPYADQVIESGNGVELAGDLTPGLMTVAFVGSGKFVKERPEVAKRFVLALTEAARMMQGDDYLVAGEHRRLPDLHQLDRGGAAQGQPGGLRPEHGDPASTGWPMSSASIARTAAPTTRRRSTCPRWSTTASSSRRSTFSAPPNSPHWPAAGSRLPPALARVPMTSDPTTRPEPKIVSRAVGKVYETRARADDGARRISTSTSPRASSSPSSARRAAASPPICRMLAGLDHHTSGTLEIRPGADPHEAAQQRRLPGIRDLPVEDGDRQRRLRPARCAASARRSGWRSPPPGWSGWACGNSPATTRTRFPAA